VTDTFALGVHLENPAGQGLLMRVEFSVGLPGVPVQRTGKPAEVAVVIDVDGPLWLARCAVHWPMKSERRVIKT